MEVGEEGDFIYIYIERERGGGREREREREREIIYRYTVTTKMTPALRRAAMRAVLMFH